MNSNFNLPPGVSLKDIDPEPKKFCERCSVELQGDEQILCLGCERAVEMQFTQEEPDSTPEQPT